MENKSEIIKKINELTTIIKNTKEYKRYIELKTSTAKNNDIMSLIKNIKKLEQTIVKKEYNKRYKKRGERTNRIKRKTE